jgi:hypothetical protein
MSMNMNPARNNESLPESQPRRSAEEPTGLDDARASGTELELDGLAGEELSSGFHGVPPYESDPAYFAPVDPVLTTDARDDAVVVNGWAPSALSSEEHADRAAKGTELGDDPLAEAVRRELLEDAMTTALRIRVQVVNGIVVLRGRVASLEDAEAVEVVASQVAGVREVRDELDIAGTDR